MTTKRHFTAMKQKDFDLIKTLLGTGTLSKSKIHNITGRAYGTIMWVEKSENLAGYMRLSRAYQADYKARKAQTNGQATSEKLEGYAHSVNAVIPDKKDETFQTMLLLELKNINENLARLAIAWETHPEKQGFLRKVLSQ